MRWLAQAAVLAALLLLAAPAYADMFQDGSNAKLPEARQNLGLHDVYVEDYGAVCDGVANDGAAIQAAIAAAGASTRSGLVVLPRGTCNIGTTTLTVGNGSASAWSTYQGIKLVGAGGVNNTLFTAFGNPDSPRSRIKYSGTAEAIRIAGPLQGWGVENLQIECTNLAGSIGLHVVSGQYGDSSNISIVNCRKAIRQYVVSAKPPGILIVDAIRNTYRNIQIVINAAAAATYTGIEENGESIGNSDFASFSNVSITASGVSGSTINDLYLGATDSSIYNNIHLHGAANDGTAGVSRKIVFDYNNTGNSGWPANTHLNGIDNTKVGVINIGTPTGQKPNYWHVPVGANQAIAPVLPHLLASGYNQAAWTPVLEGQTATGTVTYGGNQGQWGGTYWDINILMTMILSSWSGFTGGIEISGLPIPIENDPSLVSSAVRTPCTVGGVQGLTLTTNYTEIAAMIDPTSQRIRLYQNGSAAPLIKAILFPNIAQDAIINLRCQYRRKMNY